jgi:three-Cys-motif partner protein
MTKDINSDIFYDSTKLKLEIFRECFREWFPVFIHNPLIEKIFIYDFFAGSGKDAANNFGSPLVLLEEAKGKDRSYCSEIRKPIKFIFNEFIKKKMERLDVVTNEYLSNCKDKNECDACLFKPIIRNDDFKDVFYEAGIQNILTNKKYGKFILLDQYGFKDINNQIFLDLVNSPKTDFIFFISSSFIKRFKEEQSTKAYIDTENIDFNESLPKECHRIIADYFRSLIPQNKEYYVHHFTIQKGANYYGLIFGSNHSLGMEKFLKVCWKKDPLSGESNCNIDNDFEKDTLFYNPEKSNKQQQMENLLQEKILQGEIRDNISGLKYTLSNGCIPKLFTEVVKDMEKTGSVRRIGQLNYASTNIHKIRNYEIEVV